MQNDKLLLLPCPFCGGEAKIVKYYGTKIISYVECTNCLAYMGNQRIMTSSNRGKEYFESEEKLINAWNTRKPMERIVEQLEIRAGKLTEDAQRKEFKLPTNVIVKLRGKASGLLEAIDIVKGGVDNAG